MGLLLLLLHVGCKMKDDTPAVQQLPGLRVSKLPETVLALVFPCIRFEFRGFFRSLGRTIGGAFDDVEAEELQRFRMEIDISHDQKKEARLKLYKKSLLESE
ncbi:hypothetical protein V6N13_052820 [Hibiscus sabdariffa]